MHKEIEWGFFSLLIVSSPVMHMPQVRKWNISFVVLLDNHYHANEHNESKWDCVIGMHFLVLWFHLWLRPLQTARSHKTMKITSFYFHIENSIRIWLKPFADSKQVFVFKLSAAHCRKKMGQFWVLIWTVQNWCTDESNKIIKRRLQIIR